MNKIDFINELGKLPPSSTFLTVKGYLNKGNERADYSILFHFSYENALRKSIRVLKAMDLKDSLELSARDELIKSFKKSISNINKNKDNSIFNPYYFYHDANGNTIKGIKLHRASNRIHLYGLVVHKKIQRAGSWAPRNENNFEDAKRRLRRLTPAGKYRQFIMTPDQVDHISVNNVILHPPV